MRVTSRYKFFGGFGLLLGLNILVGFTCYKVLTLSNFNPPNVLNAYIGMAAFQLLFLILFMTQLRYIIADDIGITVINPLLPFLRKTRKWSDFDYYLTVLESSRGGYYESIWLIKNKRLSVRFSSFYYSNYNDLRDQIKTKGDYKHFHPVEQLLILLGLMRIRD